MASTYINRFDAVDYVNSGSLANIGTNLGLAGYIKQYDGGMNGVEVWSNENRSVKSFIWDTHHSLKLAEADNALYEDIAFTSFEGGDSYATYLTPDDNKGNLEFDRDFVEPVTALPNTKTVTGRYAYLMRTPASGTPSYIRTRELNEKEYLLTFWCMDAGSNSNLPEVKLYDGSGFKSNITLPAAVNEVGGWRLYAIRITTDEDDYIRLSGASGDPGYYIDEVRLHPVDAAMNSYTYEHLLGESSSNNAANYITYTEYDVFGRYIRTRDMRGKIIKQLEERYNDNDGLGGGSNPDPGGS